MSKLLKFLKRLVWVSVIGLMIAFHNTYNQEFKSLDDVSQEEVAEDDAE
ncbi:hypothetical protein [Ekhidna sp.]